MVSECPMFLLGFPEDINEVVKIVDPLFFWPLEQMEPNVGSTPLVGPWFCWEVDASWVWSGSI